MTQDAAATSLIWDEAGHPVVMVGDTPTTSLSELVRTVPGLREPQALDRYCEAANHLARGSAYRVIVDPEEYRSRYQERLQSEDPSAPFQQGVTRVSDFGAMDTSEIGPPRMQDGSVVFYAEDDYLGIPYRVTAPGPAKPDGQVTYEPLPVLPEAS